MHKERYTVLELSVVLFILNNSFFSTLIISMFKNYSAFEIIFSLLGTFILGYFIIYCFTNKYKNNFIYNCFNNKFINYLVSIILIVCSFVILLFSTFLISNIVKDVLLPDNNIVIICSLIIFVSYYLSTKGTKATIIATNLLFIIYTFITLIIIVFNINNASSINLLPLKFIVQKINIFYIFIIMNAPIFLLLLIKKNEIDNFYSYKKAIKKAYIFSYIFIMFRLLFILSILGTNYMSILKYPEIAIFKSINIFDFLKRLEEIFTINVFIENFCLVSLCFCYIKKILSFNEIKERYHIIIPIISILFLINFKVLNNIYLIFFDVLFIVVNLLILIKKERI